MRDTLLHHIKPKKSLGQYFLRCDWVIEVLLRAGNVDADDVILEIGPGTGVLTRALARAAPHVVAIEKDERLAKILTDTFAHEGITNVTIHTGDILKTHWEMLRELDQSSYKIVADIPYYLTGRLIKTILECAYKPDLIVLMVQKEVASRMIAKSPHHNLFALSVQVYGLPSLVTTVPRQCFTPAPKVDSAIVSIKPYAQPLFLQYDIEKDIFFKYVKKAFGKKRKMLSNSLEFDAHLFPLYAKKRPEALTIEEWCELITQIEHK